MTNRDRREALRGAEEETFDIIAQVLTSDQWAELLKAPLERAALQGHRGLAQKLVRAGAEIGDALHEAIWGGCGDVVSDLLENGAPVDAKECRFGMTPLHYAAKEGETEILQLLLLKGADKDAMDNDDSTPLYVATMRGHVAAALALIGAGADVTLRCGHTKRSVAHMAAKRGHVDVLRALIEHGADVEAVDTDGRALLHLAAGNDRVEAINFLLEAEANIEARDRDGGTPLHYSAGGESNLEAVLALLKHGADVNAQDKNQETPLHWAAVSAAAQGAVEVVDSLLRSGADETILNIYGEAPADVVAKIADEEDLQLDEDIEQDVDRVRELLASAPADRAWRRRGYLVLCRAHPDRVQQAHESSSARAGVTRTRSRAQLARTEAAGRAEVCTGGEWAGVVARVLGLQEEGIFRTILGYL